MFAFDKPSIKKESYTVLTRRNIIVTFFINIIFKLSRLNRQRSVFPVFQILLKALYLATFETTKKWSMSLRNWGKVYGELSIMYPGRLPE